MRKILITCRTGYDRDYAASTLLEVFQRDMKAAVLPLEYEEGWASDRMEAVRRFDHRSDRRYDIERPLRAYGVKNFTWLVGLSPEETEKRIKESDILCLFGEDASECMERIEDLGLYETIRNYDGILIVLSAAARILEDTFETGEDRDRRTISGLGILSAVHLLLHYDESEEAVGKMIRMLERDGQPILVLSEQSAVYLEEGRLELLGGAFIADENDLDELYSLL